MFEYAIEIQLGEAITIFLAARRFLMKYSRNYCAYLTDVLDRTDPST